MASVRNNMKIDVRTIAISAMLVAVALVLSLLEGWIPVAVSVPGIRLGLANIATVFAIYVLGALPALIVVVLRCILGAIFAGSFTSLAFSLCGGLLAYLIMWLLSMSRRVSPIGVCVGGAGAHSIGQILAAIFVLGSRAPLTYLPVLLLVSVVTGLLTGVVSDIVLAALSGTTAMIRRKKENPAEDLPPVQRAEPVLQAAPVKKAKPVEPPEPEKPAEEVDFEKLLASELGEYAEPEHEEQFEGVHTASGETYEDIMAMFKADIEANPPESEPEEAAETERESETEE